MHTQESHCQINVVKYCLINDVVKYIKVIRVYTPRDAADLIKVVDIK